MRVPDETTTVRSSRFIGGLYRLQSKCSATKMQQPWIKSIAATLVMWLADARCMKTGMQVRARRESLRLGEALSMIIRPLQPGDLESVTEIYNEVLTHSTAVFRETLTTVEERTEWWNTLREKGYPIL